MRGWRSGAVLGVAAAIAACGGRGLAQPKITGTCDGACAHYIECKPGHPEADRATCEQECPGVFSDEESLMGYESLECRDAVEYIDGTRPRHASTATPGD